MTLFGSGLIVIGWAFAILGRKLGRNQGSKID